MGREREKDTEKQIQREKRGWDEAIKETMYSPSQRGGMRGGGDGRWSKEVKGEYEKREHKQKRNILNVKQQRRRERAQNYQKIGRMIAEGEVKPEITKGNVTEVRGGENTKCWQRCGREKENRKKRRWRRASISTLGELINRAGRCIITHITATGKHTWSPHSVSLWTLITPKVLLLLCQSSDKTALKHINLLFFIRPWYPLTCVKF